MFSYYEYPDTSDWNNPSRSNKNFLSLPAEVLDQIISELDLRSDLTSLALANRTCYHLVVPRHSEYRVIRTRHRLAAMWGHLARRSDLARNVRKVHCCSKDNHTTPDQYPSSLVPQGPSNPQQELHLELTRLSNICIALRHMTHLQEFIWENPDDQQLSSSLSACNEGDILESLGESTRLTHLSLSGAMRLRPSSPARQLEQIWNMKHLRYVCLRGEVWGLPSMGGIVQEFLMQSPLLEFLEVPLEITSLADSLFPSLKKLRLFLQSGAGSSSAKSWSTFVANHLALEEFSCTPLLVNLPADGLPLLKCFQTDINSLGEFGTAHNTPSLDSIDATLPLNSLGEKFLKSGNCSNLRRLCLRTWPTTAFLRFTKVFPNLTWLSVEQCPVMQLDNLLCYLSQFRYLEVFRGHAIWKSVDYNDDRMHLAIVKLVQMCLNLRELDHRTYYAKRRAYKRIVITREEQEDGSLGVTYEVRKPPPRSCFDTAGGIFD
ncbi:hypothetical protein E1B28_007087 [Marasmius oreades]|uniref:F-box domain-containing protein n=1 Tax=Marasmius oreades TaxID=181124 RepID=A0A9P7S167_9AGAR|nr:uncharacterized protein E1B28_007087 [Marasmius oreades]KAG7093405.1 hypothetical protein E1B28_007087 [Marasmius oreades]